MLQLCGAKQKSTFTCREENLTVLTQNMEQVMRHRPERSKASGQRATNTAVGAAVPALLSRPYWFGWPNQYNSTDTSEHRHRTSL